MITVSAVIPTYNRAACVGEAIESALAQSVACHEVIVVDDGSIDETPSVVSSFGDRVRTIRQENGGVSAARNTGIRAATGNWIAFLDSDDLWVPERIEMLVDAARTYPQIVLHAGDCLLQTRDGKHKSLFAIRGVTANGLTYFDRPLLPLALPSSVAITAVAVRKKCFSAVSFDQTLNIFEDHDVLIQLAAAGAWAVTSAPAATARRAGDTKKNLTKQAIERRAYTLNCRCILLDRATTLPKLTKEEYRAIRRALAGALRDLAMADGTNDFRTRLGRLAESARAGRSARSMALACIWPFAGNLIQALTAKHSGYRRSRDFE